MFLILCELAVQFAVAMSSQKSDNTSVTRQPLGLHICLKLCSTNGGRRSHTFDPVQLICTPEIMTVKRRSCHCVNLTTGISATSPRYSRTIYPRQKGHKNVTQTYKVSRYKKADKKGAAKNKKADKNSETRSKNPDKESTPGKKKADIKGSARNKNAEKKGSARNKNANKKGLARIKKTDKKGAARNKEADKKGSARNKNANKKGSARNKKADKKSSARNKNADKKGSARRKKADKKGLARNKKTDKKGAARNKKVHKKGNDVTHKRRTLHLIPKIMKWNNAWDVCKKRGWTLVLPKTKEEVDDLSQYIHDHRMYPWHGLRCFWLGLSMDRYTFFWIDGVHTRKSLLRAKRGCGVFYVHPSRRLKQWRIVDCTIPCRSICQK